MMLRKRFLSPPGTFCFALGEGKANKRWKTIDESHCAQTIHLRMRLCMHVCIQVLYCSVTIRLYSASLSVHQSETCFIHALMHIIWMYTIHALTYMCQYILCICV